MKKFLLIIAFTIFGFICAVLIYFNFIKKENNKKQIKINQVVDNYSEYVKIFKTAKLYDNDKKIAGSVSNDLIIKLDDKDKTLDDNYYKLKNEDIYIKAESVRKAEPILYENNEYKFYKNYIPYNENIVTDDEYKLYFDDNNYIEINKSDSYPIIIKDDNKYGIEYNDSLVYIDKSDVKKVENSNNTTLRHTDAIAILNYHYTIDEYSDEAQECRQSLCMTQTQVEEQIKYLKDNGFYATSMQDLYLFLTGKIQLPEKSVTITIDDGWYVARMISILEKYQMLGTLYLIGSLASPNDYRSNYLEIHSHSWDLHTPKVCSGVHGGGLLCEDENIILEDLKKSRESLNNTEVFCYPFYEYNTRAIELLKNAGFKMAFAGGSRKAKVNDNLFIIPRYELLNTITMDRFKKIVN